MIVTEKQAKNLLCHRALYNSSKINCKTSKCMAWRWFAKLKKENNEDRIGYCGLIVTEVIIIP